MLRTVEFGMDASYAHSNGAPPPHVESVGSSLTECPVWVHGFALHPFQRQPPTTIVSRGKKTTRSHSFSSFHPATRGFGQLFKQLLRGGRPEPVVVYSDLCPPAPRRRPSPHSNRHPRPPTMAESRTFDQFVRFTTDSGMHVSNLSIHCALPRPIGWEARMVGSCVPR